MSMRTIFAYRSPASLCLVCYKVYGLYEVVCWGRIMNIAVGIFSLDADHWQRGCARFWRLAPFQISDKDKGTCILCGMHQIKLVIISRHWTRCSEMSG
jgi:hypothetical protein